MIDREAFEKWLCGSNKSTSKKALQRNVNGVYCSQSVHWYWTGWQAACEYKDEVIIKRRARSQLFGESIATSIESLGDKEKLRKAIGTVE